MSTELPYRLEEMPNAHWFRRLVAERNALRSWIPVFLFNGTVVLLAFWIGPVLAPFDLAVLFTYTVMFSALRWGRNAFVVSVTLSVLSMAVLLRHTLHEFAVTEPWRLTALIGITLSGAAMSALVVTTREEAKLSERRRSHTSALRAFVNTLVSSNELEEIVEAVASHFTRIFDRPVILLLPGENGLAVRYRSAAIDLTASQYQIAQQVFTDGRERGSGMRYVPLKAGRGTVGVIGFQTGDPDALPKDFRELLDVFIDQTALAITRADFANVARSVHILEHSDKLQRALFSTVSHNLRGPLASVLGALSTVLDDGALLDSSAQECLLQTAQEEARRLDWLLRNLLDMTRLEGGTIPMRLEHCDVRDVIATAVQQLGEAGRNHPIEIHLSDELPLVPMDHVLIVEVLVNLLDNALKYSPAQAPIEVEAQVHGDCTELRVLDRGPGIPENDLERIFDKFFRVPIAGAPKGAGLGLSICKGFVEAHNGKICATRRAFGGMEFAFSLPLKAIR